MDKLKQVKGLKRNKVAFYNNQKDQKVDNTHDDQD